MSKVGTQDIGGGKEISPQFHRHYNSGWETDINQIQGAHICDICM